MIPCCGIRPTVGFSPTMPLSAAGQTIDPFVSVPIESSAKPAATAAPEPLDEPPGDRLSAYGLRVRPPYPLQPDDEDEPRKLAHSLRLVLPRMMQPASRNRRTSGASYGGGGWSASASDPAVVGRSAVSMLSFTSTAIPCSGPRTRPSSRSVSNRAASVRASGFGVQTALISGSSSDCLACSSSTVAMAGRGPGDTSPGPCRVELTPTILPELARPDGPPDMSPPPGGG